MPQIGYSHRPVALGHRGMVAAAHPLATLTGVEVLKAGGTAADAAVAVNGVLAVTQPNMCGVGGDLFCLYYEAETRRVHFLNGAGRSGSRAGLDALGRRGMDRLPVIGPATVSVPGCVRAWGMLLERFGTRRLGDLLAPAVHYAGDGFPLSSLVSQAIAEFGPITPDPEWHRVFEPGGRAPRMGERFVQAALPRTLADVTVWQTPPPTQGLAALLALNLLEGFPVAEHPIHSAEHLHLLLEMVKLAYADRDRWIGDPAHARVPVAELLSKDYAARRRREFDPRKAQSYRAGDPEGDTTGFVVADGRGNVASVIQSLFNGFGSGVVAPGTGVVLQNRGRHFSLEPGHPAVFASRKRPFHTLIASILTRDERPLLGFATMGGNGQAMFHAQVLTNVLDYGLDIQEAIERPRFIIGAYLPGEPTEATHVEARVPAPVLAALEARGHPVKTAPAFFGKVGHAQGVALREGTLLGGADPRGDGAALGF